MVVFMTFVAPLLALTLGFVAGKLTRVDLLAALVVLSFAPWLWHVTWVSTATVPPSLWLSAIGLLGFGLWSVRRLPYASFAVPLVLGAAYFFTVLRGPEAVPTPENVWFVWLSLVSASVLVGYSFARTETA